MKLPSAMLPPPMDPVLDTSFPLRLHVGCGRARMAGWLNIDIQALPGVDLVADVTKGLDVPDGSAEVVYAEHFLEHLPLADALRFLAEVHRVLAPGGWVRLSTPNLEWVWSTHYRLDLDFEGKRDAALRINRAFHGWRHQFLWNREMLEEALLANGFDEVRWCRYGESALPVFDGIERHEQYDDYPDLPHVLVVEARKGAPRPECLASFQSLVGREFLMHMND